MKHIIFHLLSFCLAVAALAHTTFESSFTCPIDRKKFKQVIDGSGTQFGMRLDYKPLGPTPAPWAVPQCPTCKFILYDESIEKKTLEKLRPFILSDTYQNAASGHSSYFCLALIREFLEMDSFEVGDAYLKASWQVEADPEKCRESLRLAYEKFSAGLKSSEPPEEQFVGITLLLGELERRLGKFSAASARFDRVRKQEKFKGAEIQKVINREVRFISERDAAPHAAAEKQESLVKEE